MAATLLRSALQINAGQQDRCRQSTHCCGVPQAELKEKLTKMYDVRDINSVFVFGFRNQVRPAGADWLKSSQGVL
jgi:hypothetical protein